MGDRQDTIRVRFIDQVVIFFLHEWIDGISIDRRIRVHLTNDFLFRDGPREDHHESNDVDGQPARNNYSVGFDESVIDAVVVEAGIRSIFIYRQIVWVDQMREQVVENKTTTPKSPDNYAGYKARVVWEPEPAMVHTHHVSEPLVYGKRADEKDCEACERAHDR